MNGELVQTVVVSDFISFTFGMIVFFLGAFLTRNFKFLQDYNIPEPVAGGLAVALFTWALYGWFGVEISFQLSIRDELLVVFFTTIGLNARIRELLSGGRLLALLLAVTLVFMVLQNMIGVFGANLFGLPQQVGVLLGSASLIGGHGTAIAWGPTIVESTDIKAAAEIGIAAATLGLVCAALIGGPIAKILIDRNGLVSRDADGPVVGLPYEEEGEPNRTVNHINLMESLLVISIAIILGVAANEAIDEFGLKLPLFVSCLLMGVLLSNTIPFLFPKMIWPTRSPALAVISDYSLSTFLAMSLMSMQLWGLQGLGGPLLGVLAAQVVCTVLFILFIFFRIMGRDYMAAVLSAGFAGFTLGATPTAIANMSSVTRSYGPAPLAFIVLPLVSAFFVDLANALIITAFVKM